MKKNNIIICAALLLIAVVTVVYAAYSTTLIVNGSMTSLSKFGIVLTGCTTETVVTGISGGKAPTATCTPAGTNTGEAATCVANFNQPGDSVRCNFNIKNTGTLNAKSSGYMICSSGDSSAGGFVSLPGNKFTAIGGNVTDLFPDGGLVTGLYGLINGANMTTSYWPDGNTYSQGPYGIGDTFLYNSGMYLTAIWQQNPLSAGQTLTRELSITLTASTNIDSATWSSKTIGSATCYLNYVQNI